MSDSDSYRANPGATPDARGSRRIFEALADRTPHPRAKRMLTDLFGRSARGGPNTAAAAEGLGVSRRTVQRWIHDGIPARSPHAAQMRQQWSDSPAGRRASISPARRKELRDGTGDIGGRITAHVWVHTDDPRNGLKRSFAFSLSRETARELMELSAAGRDAEAHRLLESRLPGFGGAVDLDLASLDIRW